MEKGILFVFHGRKNKISTANLQVTEAFAGLSYPTAIGYLEGDYQKLEDALGELSQQVNEIVIVPFLLFPATHYLDDLPERVEAVLGEKVSYRILSTLGKTKAIYQFLLEQGRLALLKQPKTKLLLVIHGSPHYQEPDEELAEIAEQLQEELQTEVIASSYLGKPDFKEILSEEKEAMIIQRIFLSEGYLATKIVDWIKENRTQTDVLLPTLENSSALEKAVSELLEQANVSIND